jgi:hypothetical protein
MRGIRGLNFVKFDYFGIGKSPAARLDGFLVITGPAGQNDGPPGSRHVDTRQGDPQSTLRWSRGVLPVAVSGSRMMPVPAA